MQIWTGPHFFGPLDTVHTILLMSVSLSLILSSTGIGSSVGAGVLPKADPETRIWARVYVEGDPRKYWEGMGGVRQRREQCGLALQATGA